MDITEFLIIGNKLQKRYKNKLSAAIKETNISLIEAEILLFLQNNPTLNTATDIVEYRGFLKSAVSKSVESLIQKGYLKRVPEQSDRRKIHLVITEQTEQIIIKLVKIQRECITLLLKGISKEELEIYMKVIKQFSNNLEEQFKK